MATTNKELRDVKTQDLFRKVLYRRSDGSEGGGQFNCYPDLDYAASTVGDDEWSQKYDYEFRPMSDKASLKAAGLSTDEINDSKRLDEASKGIEETAARHGMKVVDAREFLESASDQHFAPEKIRERELAAEKSRMEYEQSDKSKRDVGDLLFGYWDADDDGEDVWRRKFDGEILNELGIDRTDLRNEKRFEAAVAKIDEMARREGCTEHNGREYLKSVVEREAKQSEMARAYFDRAEQRRAAAAQESNARLEKLEASRAAERAQKQTHTPRVSM